MTMLDYYQLEALAAVVEEGGFEKAGIKLHITQSAVTQRIRQLEERTGQILLIRSQPPGVTEQGRVLLEHFRKVRLLENELPSTGLNPVGGAEDNGLMVERPVIPLAVNADSLATWFSDVIAAYMSSGPGLLDIMSADQDITHKMLARGEVMGSISASGIPARACRTVFLGNMVYRLVCTSGYRHRYFPDGITGENFRIAPKMNFNRDDQLLNSWAEKVFPENSRFSVSHFVPSSEQSPILISKGSVCGMVTDEQFLTLKDEMDFVDLSMGQPVTIPLYWHRWAIESAELDRLTELILKEAEVKLKKVVRAG